MKRIASITSSSLIALLTVLFVALLSPAPVHSQSGCAQLGVDCSHPTTPQRPPTNERSGGESSSNGNDASGDTSSQVSRYNHNLKQMRKGFELAEKGVAAEEKGNWSDAAKFFNKSVQSLPSNFNGGVGSDKQERTAAYMKTSWWVHHAYCIYHMGQLELAASEFQWVIENSTSAKPEVVEWARKNIVVIQQELYEMAMEKKKQEALKLHNRDFHP